MPAYWIARSKINDPVEYKKYTDRAGAIVVKFGGRILARGEKISRAQVQYAPGALLGSAKSAENHRVSRARE